MARKVIVELIDDFDGKSRAEETVSFSLEGVEYEIDLSAENAGKIRSAFEQWTGPARKVGRTSRSKAKGGTRSAPDKQKAGAIREWAKRNGYNVSSRGRVQADIVEAYNKAS